MPKSLPHSYKQSLYDPAFEHDACGIGFVADIKGRRSNTIVRRGLTVLRNLHHRGATGSESETGDGAGILIQIPHHFLRSECAQQAIDLPDLNQYAVGMVFLPPDPRTRRICEERFEDIVHREGLRVLGWRTVPTHPDRLGATAHITAPAVRQVFIKRPLSIEDDLAFERKLYVVRKSAKKEIRDNGSLGGEHYYISSLSSRTIVYKGMLTALQLGDFYPELMDPRLSSALILLHSRFSTNTFPSWDRAHPYRYMVHNGEINTLRSNVNWFRAREKVFRSKHFGDDLSKVLPVLDDTGSDSAIFDNCLEFLTLAGRPLEEVMMMMIPEPWENDLQMRDDKRAFYEYHSCLMQPWDGPAAIAFCDGVKIGAALDRNGLRPGRFYITNDDLVIMGSECGVLDIPEDSIVKKGRLRPGRMLLIDTVQGKVFRDHEIKAQVVTKRPYRKWLNEKKTFLKDQPDSPNVLQPDAERVLLRQKAFGYTSEDIDVLLKPMAQMGVEPVWAMGSDTPLAVLSERPQLLYDYFHQLFAQVTNPPIDSVREALIMASGIGIGPEGNLLDPGPKSCHQVMMDRPVLTNEELAKIRDIESAGFQSTTLPILFNTKAKDKAKALEQALNQLFEQADRAIRSGSDILILSDRGFTRDMAPIPALLAVAGLHHHLIGKGTRTRVGLVLESGSPREVHHLATLVSYGAAGVNPYVAFDTLYDQIRSRQLPDLNFETAQENYIKALSKGLIKVLSKMGISTVRSYCGAQIFEAVGICQSVIVKYFQGTSSRIEGIGLEQIAQEVVLRHSEAYSRKKDRALNLDQGGLYKYHPDGEVHQYNPHTIKSLRNSVRNGDYTLFKQFSSAINDESKKLKTLRGLIDFKRKACTPIPIEEVESVPSIVKRFKTAAMSFGALSQEAHETLAIAMNRLGAKSNSGEGGETSDRYNPMPNGDLRKSRIKQVASGRFGVTSEYLASADEIQIKIAQGAKPGEGGQLPGKKVYPWIAKVRHSTPGVGLISPPPHHDIYSIEDLAQLIHDLKNTNPKARISVKLVSSVGVGTIAAGVTKARADLVLISGHDGGTGAAPIGSIRHAGIPWEMGLADTHQTLVFNDLRSRVVVEVDGQLKTGRDVVIAALLGAEEFGFGTAPLIAVGCIMKRACHKNTCPVGVATQDPKLRSRYTGEPEHVINYMTFVAQEVREIMAELGVRKFEDLVGRSELLYAPNHVEHWKAKGVNLSRILYKPDVDLEIERLHRISQDHKIAQSYDRRILLKACESALDQGELVESYFSIRNTDRVVGTTLGHEITKRFGAKGLPNNTISLHFRGSAGQSFGAFIPPGLTLYIHGDANDYIGKGLSGGKIIVKLPEQSQLTSHDNVIIGNVAFFGATSGEAYIQGKAGERFCVRNSGLKAVVEGVGDHGCEYMTGGRVLVLGRIGKNFAAGMSGGVAYVYDEADLLPLRCNPELVDTEAPEKEDLQHIHAMLKKHVEYTGSTVAQSILSNWLNAGQLFVKIMPRDYRRVLETQNRLRAEGLDEEKVIHAAFTANLQDNARIEGR